MDRRVFSSHLRNSFLHSGTTVPLDNRQQNAGKVEVRLSPVNPNTSLHRVLDC